ncbi:MAG: ParB/RepB/Spo0J family partition protein [Desulfovibrionaceae bacterium]
MSSGQRGLGRGLDALFENTANTSLGAAPANGTPAEFGNAPRNVDVTSLPLDALIPNPQQPRKNFDREALQELANSIASQGLIQPILVRLAPGQAPNKSPHLRYEIVAGERRWRAARLAGLTKIPVFVRTLSDEDVMAAALIENLQREDLNPIEEALAFQTLRDQFALTQEDMAKRLGKNRSTVANALRLLQLSEAAQNDLKLGHIHAGHARALLSIADPEAQEQLRAAIAQLTLTVRDAEMAALTWKAHKKFPWQEQDDSPSDTLAPIVAEKTPAQHSAPRSKSPQIKALQESLSQQLHIHTRISGSEEKGKITLSYQSPEDLARILQQLGLA